MTRARLLSGAAGMLATFVATASPHAQVGQGLADLNAIPEATLATMPSMTSKYQPNGTYTSGRATRNLDRLPIHRDGDAVVVNVTQVFKSDQDAAGWNSAAIPA